MSALKYSNMTIHELPSGGKGGSGSGDSGSGGHGNGGSGSGGCGEVGKLNDVNDLIKLIELSFNMIDQLFGHLCSATNNPLLEYVRPLVVGYTDSVLAELKVLNAVAATRLPAISLPVNIGQLLGLPASILNTCGAPSVLLGKTFAGVGNLLGTILSGV